MIHQVLSFDFPPNEIAYKCIEKDLSNAWEFKRNTENIKYLNQLL